MNKKLLVMAVALTASLVLTANAFGVTGYPGNCSSGVNVQFLGVGSSAQANALAYAARFLTQDSSGNYNLVSAKKGVKVIDSRVTPNPSDGANPFWVVWDGSCNVYAYMTIDSGAGVRAFMAYSTLSFSGNTYTSVGATYGNFTDATISTNDNVIAGLADTDDSQVGTAGSDFELIEAKLAASPASQITGGAAKAPAYCGNSTTVAAKSQFWCYFNAAGTDIRPEDALYATTRALTSYDGFDIAASGTENSVTKVSTGNLTGLGYNTATPGASCTPSKNVGCTISDSFDQGKAFNVLNFALSGKDPIGDGTVPGFTTVSVGADPVVVIVRNGNQFGQTDSNGNFIYNNINRQTLAQIFSGFTGCAEDILTTTASWSTTPHPIQVVHREPLSGTYNTFEFTAVRTLGGSSNPLTDAVPGLSNADNGQEQFNDPAKWPGGNGTACTLTGGYPQSNCFNPLYLQKPNSACAGTTNDVPVRLRAIGTGEEVAATIGTYNSGAGNASIDNGIGYAFWGYGNLDPLCSGGNTNNPTNCTGTVGGGGGSYVGHYLTVDGIDPLFETPGGQGWNGTLENPSGVAFEPPYCNLSLTSPSCNAIAFPHIYDGSYPLWSMLRTVTFAPSTGKVSTPQAVLNIVAAEELESGTGGDGLSDFVPFLNSVCPPNDTTSPCNNSTSNWVGNLNLFVFREHYKQTNSPADGYIGCKTTSPNFTDINLQGGSKTASTCLVDFGGDVGGSVIPVQKNIDYDVDWSSEEFYQHQ